MCGNGSIFKGYISGLIHLEFGIRFHFGTVSERNLQTQNVASKHCRSKFVCRSLGVSGKEIRCQQFFIHFIAQQMLGISSCKRFNRVYSCYVNYH